MCHTFTHVSDLRLTNRIVATPQARRATDERGFEPRSLRSCDSLRSLIRIHRATRRTALERARGASGPDGIRTDPGRARSLRSLCAPGRVRTRVAVAVAHVRSRPATGRMGFEPRSLRSCDSLLSLIRTHRATRRTARERARGASGPDGIRTHDHLVKSQTLCRTELPALGFEFCRGEEIRFLSHGPGTPLEGEA